MNTITAIKYLEESKCDQKQGELHQKTHNEALDKAIGVLKLIEKWGL